jgi:hypothetical protein
MKWRMVDRVLAFQPWQSLTAVKAVSFEELTLLERWGRPASLPPSLCLEAGVEAVRWLVAASSGFTLATLLAEAADFQFVQPLDGEILRAAISVKQRDAASLCAAVSISAADAGGTPALRTAAVSVAGTRGVLAHGSLSFSLVRLDEYFDAEWLRGVWQDLGRDHGAAR